ncbi:MAG: hypothetical protein JSW67_12890 [Candidatus Latescibacterota bacterium]|nr:MAG: hypothetical protein JSW67_12890 [Candidatus Latescibacterota bacterium]
MRRPVLASTSVATVGVLLLAAGPALSQDSMGLERSRPPSGVDLRLHDELRSYDGSGNNPTHPEWGRADIPLLRHMVEPHYADGTGTPDVANMPSARAVSNAVVAQPAAIANEVGVNDLFWQWGQFLDHDLDLTPAMVPSERFDIPVPAGDAEFDPSGSGGVWIPLERSIYSMVDGVRQQMNEITAYIDAGNVYGSNAARARELRTLDGSGRLKTSAGRLLPYNVSGYPNAPSADPGFFLAGDVRANEQVGLTALHTLFVREHNWVANRLHRQAPHWSGDQLYQMARAIVGAEIQVITYQEFLPLLLGPDAMAPYGGYRTDVNPGIDNAFSSAAYRLGHSMVSDVLLRLKHNGEPIADGNLPLAQSFFAPEKIHSAGGIEPILRGLATQRAQEIDAFIVDGLRNFLFGEPGAGGFDLAALNIQRGRDHGMKRYNDCRRALGLAPCTSFADVSSDAEIQSRLAAIYADVDEIDLWVGGLAEDHLPGAMVGELFHAILSDQFERLRAGDRFWYANDFQPWMVRWLEGQTLAAIIRRNTSIGKEIQNAALVAPPAQLAQLQSPQTSPDVESTARSEWGEAYPNPARVGSGVWLELPAALRGASFEVGIYDVRGRRVRELRSATAGDAIYWDGRTATARPAQSGVYFMRVRVGQSALQRRILLID